MNVMCHDIHDKYLAKKYCNEDAFFCDFIRRPQRKSCTFATSMNETEKSAVKDKNCEG